MYDEGNDKRPPRPMLLLAKFAGHWDWYAREMRRHALWIGTSYTGGALAIGDFEDMDRELSDADAVATALQDVESEKSAADQLGGTPHLPGWERI